MEAKAGTPESPLQKKVPQEDDKKKFGLTGMAF